MVSYTTKQIDNAVFNSAASDIRGGKVLPLNSSASKLINKTSYVQDAAKPATSKVTQSISSQVQSTLAPVFNVIKAVSKVTSFISSTVAEFSRTTFASAVQSPLAAAQAVRSIVCKAIDFVKTFNLNILAGFKWPPSLPNLRIPSFKKAVSMLIMKIGKMVWKMIYNFFAGILDQILATIARFYNMIDEMIRSFKNFFTCNPGDAK